MDCTTDMADDMPGPSSRGGELPACYLIVYNVSKVRDAWSGRWRTACSCPGRQRGAPLPAPPPRHGARPRHHCRLPSVQKHNIGTLARCATAFNVRQLCLVGTRSFNTFGSQGSDIYVDLCHYDTIEECCADLRGNKGACGSSVHCVAHCT